MTKNAPCQNTGNGFLTKLRILPLLLIGCLLLGSQVLAQTTRIHLERTTLAKVVAALQKQFPQTNFSYNLQAFEQVKIEQVQAEGGSLQALLEDLRKKVGLHALVDGNNVTFKHIPIENKPVTPASKKNPGRVTGKIIDEQSGQSVPDVTVRIGNRSSISALDGSFSIALAQGVYEAEITSVGYGKKVISDIAVKDGQTVVLNVTLVRAKGQLESVVVRASAKKESVASLYARQKNSVAVSDGISAEQISRTPDNNAAQALKRISGLTVQDEKFVTVRGLSERYNNVLLNGASLPSTEQNRRNFSFDIIPSGLIDQIVINKTATPDMPSEFAGGLVQVNTKDIPTENYTTLSAGTGINTNSAGKEVVSLRRSDKAMLGYDDRRSWWGRDWKREEYAPLYYSGNWEKAAAMNHRIPNNWGLVRYKYQPVQNYQVGLGRRFDLNEQSLIGITLAGTYRNEQVRVNDFSQTPSFYKYDSANTYHFNTAWGVIGNIAYQTKRHKIVFKNLYNRKYSQESTVNYGKEYNFRVSTRPGGDDVLYYSDVLVINDLLHNRLEGEHQLYKNLKIDWAFDNININRQQPDTRSSIGYQGSGPKGYYEYIHYELGGFITRGNNIFNSKLDETKRNAALNISVPFEWMGQKQLIKGGYAGSFRKAAFRSTALRLMSDPTATMANIEKVLFGVPDYSLHDYLKPGLLTYRYISVASGDGGEDYKGKQDLHAAYLMVDLQLLKHFRLIGGVRMESNNMEVHGISFNQQTGLPVDSTMRYHTVDWLPSGNLVYKLNNKMNLRLAYSKTTARADFRERSPFVYYDFRDRSVYRGAVGLKDAFVDNLDLRYEFYPAAGEVVSLSVFHKKFTHPVELIGVGSAPLQFFYFNLDKSVNNGVEVDFRKKLGFIAPSVRWLNDLYVSGNFSWMKADVKYNPQALMDAAADAGVPGGTPGATRDRPLQGMSPYAINAAIGYDGKTIGATVSYNRFGKRIVNGGFSPYQDQYERPRDVIDLQFSTHLFKEQLLVRLNISDLLQQDYIIYQNAGLNKDGEFHVPVEVINSSNPNDDPKGTSYNKEKDLLYRKWFKGRNISLSFTYRF